MLVDSHIFVEIAYSQQPDIEILSMNRYIINPWIMIETWGAIIQVSFSLFTPLLIQLAIAHQDPLLSSHDSWRSINEFPSVTIP